MDTPTGSVMEVEGGHQVKYQVQCLACTDKMIIDSEVDILLCDECYAGVWKNWSCSSCKADYSKEPPILQWADPEDPMFSCSNPACNVDVMLPDGKKNKTAAKIRAAIRAAQAVREQIATQEKQESVLGQVD